MAIGPVITIVAVTALLATPTLVSSASAQQPKRPGTPVPAPASTRPSTSTPTPTPTPTPAQSTTLASPKPTVDSSYALTIEQAVAIAQQNNPDYRIAVTNRRTASAAKRAARGAFLPQISASMAGQYQQGGEQFVGGTPLGAAGSVLTSSYNIGVSYQINKAIFVTPRLENANADATESDIRSALASLRANVWQQYLAVLQDQETVILQDTLVASAQAQVDLSKGRAAVGSGTQLDVQRAEVSLGQQKVARIKAKNQLDIDRLRLFQQMGIPPQSNAWLTSTFTTLPTLPALDSLQAMAYAQNPAVQALRSRRRAAELGVSRSKGEYLPTLSLSTGIGGQTYSYRDPNFPIGQAQAQTVAARQSCVQTQEVRATLGLPNTLADCANIQFTDAQAEAIRRSNDQFPFDFQKTPRTVTVQLSLPIFDGFAREQRLQQAIVQQEDARYNVRTRELALAADVTVAYLTLQAAQETVLLQRENAAKAHQELKYTQDQYVVGLATFVDLTTSRAAYAQAETDRINAEYDYHKDFAVLESTVGRPLR